MGKEKKFRLKRGLATLLAVLFFMSCTTLVATATRDHFNPAWGPNSKNAYNTAYHNMRPGGVQVGMAFSTVDGISDCQNGLSNSGGNSRSHHITTTSTSAQDLGRIDGYNDGLDAGYTKYGSGYRICKNGNQQNSSH